MKLSPSIRSTRLALAVGLLALALPARAEYDQSFSFDAQSLRLGNLIGAIEVQGHSGSAFEVQVHVRGEDAEDGIVTFEPTQGGNARLMVRFPDDERRYVYPPMGGRSRSTFSQGRSNGWWEDFFGRDRIEVRGSGNGLELWADITVKVPKGGELFLINGAGEVQAKSVEGHLELATKVGRIEATDVTGSLLADTGSGHVEIDGVRGDLKVDTGSGHVSVVDVEGEKIAIDTGSGHVELSDAKAPHVEVDTGSGNVDLDRVISSDLSIDTGSGGVEAVDVEADEILVDTGSGSVRVDLTRMGDGTFEIDTGSGSITFMMPSEASAVVSAETGSGGIDVDVDGAQMRRQKRDHVEFEVGSGDARVRLDTGSGRIRVASR